MLIVSAMLLTMAGCAKPAEPVADEETAVVSEVQEEPVAEDTTEAVEDTVEEAVTTDEVEAAVEEEADVDTTEAVEETVAEADTEDEDANVEEVEETETTEEVKEEASTDNSAADTSKIEESKTEEKKSNIPDWFDASYYAANNSDVVAALGNSADALYNHYVNHGKAEGRKANADDPAERVVADNTGNESNQSSGGNGNSGSGNWWEAYEPGVWHDCGRGFFYIYYADADGSWVVPDNSEQYRIIRERCGSALGWGVHPGYMGPGSPYVTAVGDGTGGASGADWSFFPFRIEDY